MSERSGGTAFIGFSFGGEHSIDIYHVYRTSNGDRYDHNLTPQMFDKTVDVPGGDGQYYFKTNYKTRQFSIPIAFDDLDQTRFDAMKKWLNGKEIKPLVFDERTEVTYSAKVTGTPQLKYVCFDNNGTNIYKGEGTIQFTCYFPFGWEGDSENWSASSSSAMNVNTNISIGGQLPTTFEFSTTGVTGEVEIGNLKIQVTNKSFTWDSKTGLIISNSTKKPILYTGKSYGTVGTGQVPIKFTIEKGKTASISWKNLYY